MTLNAMRHLPCIGMTSTTTLPLEYSRRGTGHNNSVCTYRKRRLSERTWMPNIDKRKLGNVKERLEVLKNSTGGSLLKKMDRRKADTILSIQDDHIGEIRLRRSSSSF